MKMYQTKKAFTLIELLVVIAIIAWLLSILMPSLQKVKENARRVICKSNLHQLSICAITYAFDQDNTLAHREGGVDSPHHLYFNNGSPWSGYGNGSESPYDLRELFIGSIPVLTDMTLTKCSFVRLWPRVMTVTGIEIMKWPGK